MFPANFGYVAARSVEEALQLMAKHGEDGKLLAGGHSLIPAMKLRLAITANLDRSRHRARPARRKQLTAII